MPRDESVFDSSDSRLLELLTVDDVAVLLKVSKSWVYERRSKRTWLIFTARDTRRGPSITFTMY